LKKFRTNLHLTPKRTESFVPSFVALERSCAGRPSVIGKGDLAQYSGGHFFPTPFLGDSAVTTTSYKLARAVIRFAKAFHAARSGLSNATALEALTYLKNHLLAIFALNLKPIGKVQG
jgi:hypothetical protein